MAKITSKTYQCMACDQQQEVETNHYGTIWSSCKFCNHTGLICMEPEAVNEREDSITIETTIHFYRFDISNRAEHAQYGELKKKLLGMGLVMFDSIAMGQSTFLKKIKSMDGQKIKLETRYLFDNQWNSAAGLRLMDWSQPIYPNKDIKTGYWLEQTPEMDMVRINHQKCGYCATILHTGKKCKKADECSEHGMKKLITGQRLYVINQLH